MRALQPYAAIAIALCGFAAAPADELPPPLQRSIDAALKEVTPSVVRIGYGKPERHVTGTCIGKDGLILTCRHLSRDVGDAVNVQFAGKKPLAAKVIAKHKTLDVALIQITDKGNWPAVPLGDSNGLTARDPLLAAGFGHTDLYGRSPDPPVCYVRLGRRKEQRLWPQKDVLLTTVVGRGGDSGGPLFDLTGALVGVCNGGELDGTDTRYVSAQAVLREWNSFAGNVPKPTAARRSPQVPSAATTLDKPVRAVQPAVIEVRVDDRWAGLGVHVGRGLFLTKASELSDPISVILSDDTVAAVEVVARDPATDLALLRLNAGDLAGGLPEVRWAEANDVAQGRVVAAVTPRAFTPPVGVVCVSARSVPPIPGILPVQVKTAKGGAAVVDTFDELVTPWLRPPAFPLRTGDVVTQVAGQVIRNSDDFRKHLFRAKELGGHPRVAGAAVEVRWTRGGKKQSAWVNLRLQQSVASQRVRPYSYRYSGFSRALAADFAVRPEHCGAPVVDSSGCVIGLVIAKAPFIESLVLPGAEVRAATERMLKTLGKR